MNREELIKSEIKALGLTIKDFAKQINMPYTTLLSILKSVGGASMDNIFKICNGIHIDIELLNPTFHTFYTSNPKDIWTTIKFYMSTLHIEKKDFLKAANMTSEQFNSLKQNKELSTEELLNISKALGISVNMLVSGKVMLNTADYEQFIHQLDRTISQNEILLLDMYDQLDDNDKAEIRGEMKQMLKAEKYNDIQKELQNA